MGVDIPQYIEAPIRQKLCELLTMVIPLLPEEPEEAFVSTESRDGELRYRGIWLFTHNLVVEIRNPLSQARVQYDMARLKDAVDWIRISAYNYRFEEPSEESRLDLEFTTTDSLSSVISATREGCAHLMELYNSRFRPSFLAFVEQAGRE
jgi:hypothetical protein